VSTRESALSVAVLYPELLGTYGDSGNVVVLQRRLQWRGIPVEIVPVPLDAPVPRGCDLYLLGGGEDDAQTLALAGLRRGGGLAAAVAGGAHVFAVCAGLQLLGSSFCTDGDIVVPGLGLLDLTTGRLSRRAIGEVRVEPDPRLRLPTLTGFENHGGATRLGPTATALGIVQRGTGNGVSAPAGPGVLLDGALQGRIVATYLHGPVLARNPALADLLLERALGDELAPLPLAAVARLRAERLADAPVTRPGARSRRGAILRR
jgi:CobQ-like glutamine amidotransferase family enzyme